MRVCTREEETSGRIDVWHDGETEDSADVIEIRRRFGANVKQFGLEIGHRRNETLYNKIKRRS